MISSQRVLLLILMINVCVGITLGIAQQAEKYNNYQPTGEYENVLKEGLDDPLGETVIDSSTGVYYEPEYGNTFKATGFFWDVFWNSLNPWSTTKLVQESDGEILKAFASAMNFLRLGLAMLVTFEAVLFIRNKKTS